MIIIIHYRTGKKDSGSGKYQFIIVCDSEQELKQILSLYTESGDYYIEDSGDTTYLRRITGEQIKLICKGV